MPLSAEEMAEIDAEVARREHQAYMNGIVAVMKEMGSAAPAAQSTQPTAFPDNDAGAGSAMDLAASTNDENQSFHFVGQSPPIPCSAKVKSLIVCSLMFL